jgi:hypothetical protein
VDVVSLLDVKHAKEALAWRLKEWGVANPNEMAASFIDDLVEKGWRMDANRELRPINPKPHEACSDCGSHKRRCPGHPAEPVAPLQPVDCWMCQRRRQCPVHARESA